MLLSNLYFQNIFQNTVAKKRKLDVRAFQDNCTKQYGIVEQKDRAVCAFCCESATHQVYKDTFKLNTNINLKPQKR